MPANFPIRTMTVRELRQALFDLDDQDAPVLISYDYGDYHHTEAVAGIDDVMEDAPIVESAYSHSHYALDIAADMDEDGENDDTAELRAVVLRFR